MDLPITQHPRYGAQRREASYAVGLKGIAESDVDAVEAAVLETFERLATEGFEAERVEAVVHQIELSSRRVRRPTTRTGGGGGTQAPPPPGGRDETFGAVVVVLIVRSD